MVPETGSDGVALIAHRGCAGQYPENTLAAIARAAPRVDAVEIDVRRCGSGELVVFHDERLDRLTGATGRLADADWADLRDLTVLDSDEPVPRLAEALAALPDDTGVNVELKEAGLVADALAVADETDVDPLYSSFRPAVLDALRDAAPEAHSALLVADAEPGPAVRAATDLGCAAVHPDVETAADPAFTEAAHDSGLAVNAWTVTAETDVAPLLAADVDGIITDRWDVLDASADR
ncbi:glycerophosphodiester phosphodiesterase [Halorubrum sp. CBA1125]|uniref:glycerophosphodiester phosphodiesterase n=1 Tax=Halorubrum sp. CBA1125 TaxID=2668072 RepID=UPI00135EBD5C|nr:glycerophosphodiester phosphodiesterase [Halorubrum sp. CBA1125]MUW15061.1 glycerophosphodiester phosphodiesterase [Halorubrum sp. CBA1125]